MKNLKNLILALALFAAGGVQAQIGFDVYGGARTVIVDGPRQMLFTASGNVTNTTPLDIHLFGGIGKVDLYSFTNAPAGTLTCTVETSPDNATWTSLQNYSLASSTTVIYTNAYYGTNQTATNTFLLPGTIVSPTAATAGWATPYLNASACPFTNSGAITLPGDRVVSIGFNVEDAGRYLRVRYVNGGTATNIVAGAILTAKLLGGPGAP